MGDDLAKDTQHMVFLSNWAVGKRFVGLERHSNKHARVCVLVALFLRPKFHVVVHLVDLRGSGVADLSDVERIRRKSILMKGQALLLAFKIRKNSLA